MTDEFRAFRVLLIPLALLIIFLVMPRGCMKRASVAAEQQQAQQTTSPSTAGGLHIEGAPAAPPEAKASTYPEGLDAARIQYLVEIDSQFSAPKTATLPKTFNPNDDVIKALQKLQYIERTADGKVSLTRDGVLNLTLTENADNWTFPIAKRVFDTVTYVSRVEDDKYDGTFTWHYEPTQVGAAMNIDAKKFHSATARFINGGGTWSLMNWVTALNDSK